MTAALPRALATAAEGFTSRARIEFGATELSIHGVPVQFRALGVLARRGTLVIGYADVLWAIYAADRRALEVAFRDGADFRAVRFRLSPASDFDGVVAELGAHLPGEQPNGLPRVRAAAA